MAVSGSDVGSRFEVVAGSEVVAVEVSAVVVSAVVDGASVVDDVDAVVSVPVEVPELGSAVPHAESSASATEIIARVRASDTSDHCSMCPLIDAGRTAAGCHRWRTPPHRFSDGAG